jgi:hypothetical protein
MLSETLTTGLEHYRIGPKIGDSAAGVQGE